MGDWEPDGGFTPARDIIRLESCAVIRALLMCCPEHGVTPSVLFEFVGNIDGVRIAGTIDFGQQLARDTAQAFIEAANRC